MIIVLSGEAGAGKDSVAKVLVDNHGFVLYSLAGPLKRFAEDMFGFTQEQLYGPSSARNSVDKRWGLKCLTCNGTGVVPGTSTPHAPCDGTGKVYSISPRSVLQPLGCEYLRDMIHPDVLTIRASWDLAPMLSQGQKVVINDARFSNDRDNIHEWFGAFRVDVRAPFKKDDGADWRKHRGETDRPTDEQVEYVLENPEEWPFPGLPRRVQAMLAELTAR